MRSSKAMKEQPQQKKEEEACTVNDEFMSHFLDVKHPPPFIPQAVQSHTSQDKHETKTEYEAVLDVFNGLSEEDCTFDASTLPALNKLSPTASSHEGICPSSAIHPDFQCLNDFLGPDLKKARTSLSTTVTIPSSKSNQYVTKVRHLSEERPKAHECYAGDPGSSVTREDEFLADLAIMEMERNAIDQTKACARST
jgi:hypothetical protein